MENTSGSKQGSRRTNVEKRYPERTTISSVVQDFPVDSRTAQTPTTFTLSEGQSATLQDISGSWGIWGDSRQSDAKGGYAIAHNGGPNGNWPVPGAYEGCMVVYMNGNYFSHFTDLTLSITGPVGGGRISLGPNDNNLGDNNGSIKIRIT